MQKRHFYGFFFEILVEKFVKFHLFSLVDMILLRNLIVERRFSMNLIPVSMCVEKQCHLYKTWRIFSVVITLINGSFLFNRLFRLVCTKQYNIRYRCVNMTLLPSFRLTGEKVQENLATFSKRSDEWYYFTLMITLLNQVNLIPHSFHFLRSVL